MVTSVLLGVTRAQGTEEAVPERFLSPRHFNPHPLQTLQLLLDQYPYQQFTRAQPQRDSSPVQFPEVPEAAKPAKTTSPELTRQPPGYITVPKNYAFSYAVKDRQSGDDFSHQQAHNGAATKGEYRVKLPDGRTQIVSYTADHRGYKADVTYTGTSYKAEGLSAGSVYYRPVTSEYATVSNSILQGPADYPDEPEVIYKQPVQIVHKQNSVAQQYAPSAGASPRPLEVLFSPTPQPYKALAPLQYRALPQTAEEYTSSVDTPYYPTATPGYYETPVSSTAATPIVEDQDDLPAPKKPLPISRYYSESSTASPGVRYVLVSHPSQYAYSA